MITHLLTFIAGVIAGAILLMALAWWAARYYFPMS